MSLNNIFFVGVVGYYMSSRYKMEIVLLEFRRLRGIYSGENIVEAVFKIIRKYGLIGN